MDFERVKIARNNTVERISFMKYKYDLHVHTKEVSPCGWLNATYVTDRYIESGYAGIVLTDHFRSDFFEGCSEGQWEDRVKYYFQSYDKAKEHCKDKDFFIGLGMEIRFDNDPNDFLVYGLKKKDFINNRWMVHETIKSFYEAYGDRCLIIQAHPNREFKCYLEDIKYLHGLEVYNSNPRHNNHNEETLKVAEENPYLIATAGSDSHREEDLCRSGIETDVKIQSDEQLVAVLKSKAFHILQD